MMDAYQTLYQELPNVNAWTKNLVGLEPSHLLGALQQAAAHTRLAGASRPNKEV
jgi:hypothetical protein